MEGQQAANAADFAIGQFKYLHRLVLVHGIQNYYRVTKVICYFFYKNALVVFCQFWYCVFNGWTGQTLFEPWSLAMYNVIFTFFPCILVGVSDRTILNTDRIHEMPSVYLETQEGHPFRLGVFMSWFIAAIVHSIAIVLIMLLTPPLEMLHLNEVGTVAYTLVIVIGTLKFSMCIRSWTWIVHFFIWGSLLSWIVWLGLYGEATMVSYFLFRIAYKIGNTVDWWLYLFVMIPLCLFWDFVLLYFQLNIMPLASMKKSNLIQLMDSRDPDASTRMPRERCPPGESIMSLKPQVSDLGIRICYLAQTRHKYKAPVCTEEELVVDEVEDWKDPVVEEK